MTTRDTGCEGISLLAQTGATASRRSSHPSTNDFLTSPDGDTRKVYRTSHIHVKVKGPERTALTTQLYFPAAEGNSRDAYCLDNLLLEIEDGPSGKVGHFDLALR
jgi:protocatechuate 3,4-dioxygenase beta subunit